MGEEKHEPRRIESNYFKLTRDAVPIWPPFLFTEAPYVEGAGRHLIYRVQLPEEIIPNNPVGHMRLVELEFRLERFVHSEWVIVERGVDSEGRWEKGFYQYFFAYIPLPWPREARDEWFEGLKRHEVDVGLH